MIVTTYLIIAHLLADFIFQPNRLVDWKMKQFRGVVFHVCVFAAIALIIMFPYLMKWQTWATILAISVFHTIVDQTKINISLKHDRYVLPFIADQTLHFFSLILGGYYLSQIEFDIPNTFFFQEIYSNVTAISIFLAIIFLTYIVDILFFQQDRSRKMNTSKILSFVVIYIFYVVAALLMV